MGISELKKLKLPLILHIQTNLDSKFQLQQTILIFGVNFQKKYTSGQKQKKMNITIEFFIFESSDNCDFLDQICPKRVAIFSLKQIK